MARLALTALFALACASCSPQNNADPVAGASAEAQGLAVFAGGCYWTMEHKFESVPGVTDVVAGKAVVHGAFEAQSKSEIEAVQVKYDPREVSYRQLVDRYWLMVDPTDAGGQACDRGPSYQPAILPSSNQVADAKASRSMAAKHFEPGEFTVPLLTTEQFVPVAESEQDFAKKYSQRYATYNRGCGRDAKLRALWKGRTAI